MPNADDVLITGSSGFVGSAVARQLTEASFRVRALVRPTSARAHLAGLPMQFVLGDLRDREALRAAVAGARYVFHVAADYRLWARDPHEIFTNNVTGTRNLMEEAMRAGVERVIYTSSVAAVALRPDGQPADESGLLSVDEGVGAYKRSKIAAEALVMRLVAEQGLPAVIVNPSAPIGPRDVRPTPTGRILVEAATGGIPAFVDTGLNLTHVDDVAAGHVAALRRGRIGQRYILGGQNVLLRDLLADVACLVGRRPPRIRLPQAAVLPFAYAAEAVAWLTDRQPFVTVDGVRMASKRMFFTAAKAERELGYCARPYRLGIEDALRWFRDNGYLPRWRASSRARVGITPAPRPRG